MLLSDSGVKIKYCCEAVVYPLVDVLMNVIRAWRRFPLRGVNELAWFFTGGPTCLDCTGEGLPDGLPDD